MCAVRAHLIQWTFCKGVAHYYCRMLDFGQISCVNFARLSLWELDGFSLIIVVWYPPAFLLGDRVTWSPWIHHVRRRTHRMTSDGDCSRAGNLQDLRFVHYNRDVKLIYGFAIGFILVINRLQRPVLSWVGRVPSLECPLPEKFQTYLWIVVMLAKSTL